VFDPHARITALQRGKGRVELFVAGKDRAVYSTSRDDDKDWQEWFSVGESKLTKNAPIAALSRSPDQIELFAVGASGKVHTTVWEKESGWRKKWTTVGQAGFAEGTRVTAVVDQNALPRINLFAIGKDRRAYGTFRIDGEEWQTWAPVETMKFSPNARISAVVEPYGIDLFAVGPLGAVRSTSQVPGKGWRQWGFIGPGTIAEPISGNEMFTPGVTLAVLDRQHFGEKRTDIFGVRKDGRVYESSLEVK
jgi:hypothetical protein